jgi:glutaredoxin
MKKITMFTMASCPFCRMAHRWMDVLLKDHPEYNDIEIEIIDEVRHPDIANKYDYWYVPTYYVDGEKVHEGATTKKKIKKVYEKALG